MLTQSITSSSGGSGTIVSLDSDRGLLKIKDVTGNFNVNDTLTSKLQAHVLLKNQMLQLLQLMLFQLQIQMVNL